ncbi:hypothetical protein BY458DRAFT_502936 [Sporodiniella umbellata]|nr:hypothetical protein BY458DRAFT_502936 [Sporodiniella umbellata]
MVKGGNKVETRRSSIVAELKKESKNEESDHSKFSVIRSGKEYNVSKEIKHWRELKQECTTKEDIHNTVRCLPLENVVPLLEELLREFDTQTTRDTDLTEWIKAVLLIHTAYFMTSDRIVKKLAGVYNHLNTRLTVYPKLISMQGRLGLIQRQINYRNRLENENEEDPRVFSDSDEEDLEDLEDDEFSDEDDEDEDEDLMSLDNSD